MITKSFDLDRFKTAQDAHGTYASAARSASHPWRFRLAIIDAEAGDQDFLEALRIVLFTRPLDWGWQRPTWTRELRAVAVGEQGCSRSEIGHLAFWRSYPPAHQWMGLTMKPAIAFLLALPLGTGRGSAVPSDAMPSSGPFSSVAEYEKAKDEALCKRNARCGDIGVSEIAACIAALHAGNAAHHDAASLHRCLHARHGPV